MLSNECGLYPLDVEKEIPDEAFASDLIGFNLSGRQLPLFLIQTTVDISIIQGLARLLGPEQPVVAVNPPRGQKREDFPRRALAWSHYAMERLNRLGHPGPWRVGGWSFGGAIALRLAKLLVDSGEEVQSVVLFDTVCPDLSPSAHRNYIANPIHRIATRVNEFYDRPEEERTFRRILAAVKRRLDGSMQRRNQDRRDQMGLLTRAIHVAYLNYAKFEIDAPVALLWTEKTMQDRKDLGLGWQGYFRGPFFSQRVGYDHVEMWEESIETIAEACELFLARFDSIRPAGT